MAINKIIYGGRTLVDLTGDTATPEKVEEGVTFHDASGEQRSGTLPRTVSADNVYFSDGETFQQKYDEGELAGPAGYTPVRGTDYWTEEDQNAIVLQAVTKINTAGVVAPAYDANATYTAGDLTIYDGKLYAAKQDISTQEAWTPAHWEQITVSEELKKYVKYSTLVVTCLTQDGVTVTGQTVTVRKGSDASGPVYAQAAYNGQPVSILLPVGFEYFVSVSDTLDNHFGPTVASGVVSTPTINVTLTYSEISNISTFGDIKAALNEGNNLSGLVGKSVTATRQNKALVFDVVDYDADDESVWLLLHDTIPNQMAFEPKQALAWFGEGLPAGSYYFTHGSANYYFTLTKPIPEDGQLMATTSTFSTYANQDASTALESGSVSQTEIAGATSIGTTATGNLNYMDRVSYGSNNTGESGLFTWLNSDAEPDTNLPRLNKFSRPYSSGSDGGFLRGFDAADLECLEDVEWTIQANNVYEAPASMGGITAKGQQYTITGKIGLAKFDNIGLSDGNPWDLYVGAANTDRIKYYDGGARAWWVLDANTFSPISVRRVYYSGESNNAGALDSYGVVPACKIKKSMINNGPLQGPAGPRGPKGEPGYTPQRGTDYWTAADQAQIVQDVLSALPNASGVSI